MRVRYWLTAATLFMFTFAGLPSTWAQDRGTREEAKAMVEAAVAHVKKVGTESAFKDFQNDKATWVKKDLYIFVYTMQGVNLVLGTNEKMVGKNMWEMRDPAGRFIIKDLAATAAKGGGWYKYEFSDPLTKKFGDKESYVTKVPGFDGFIGVGFYP